MSARAHLITTRLWVDNALNADTIGVNTLLPTVPRWPDDMEPPGVEFFDWTRHPWASRMDFQRPNLPEDRGAIIIMRGSDVADLPVPGNPELRSQQANVSLVMLYLARVDAKTGKTAALAEQDASYTLSAAQLSTTKWIESTTPNDRVVARCRVVEVLDFKDLAFPSDAGRGLVGQGLLLSARVTDMFAENIP